jgi:hypothetical protein
VVTRAMFVSGCAPNSHQAVVVANNIVMNWKEFAASLIGDVLSWPVVALTIVLLLLKPLKKLIGRVKGAKGFGGEVEFSEGLEAAEDNVDEVLESEPDIEQIADDKAQTGSHVPDDKTTGPTVNPSKPDPIRDPSGAIINSWQQLANALEDLSRLKAGRGRPTRNPRLIIEQLRRNEAVNSAFCDAAVSLLALRNQVAHGETVPTQGAARTYVERAHQLEMVARGRIAVEKIDLDKPAEFASK